MTTHRLLDIREYRVRLPEPLFPYRAKDDIEVCRVGDCHGAGWLAVAELPADFFCSDFEHRNPLNMPGPFYGAETDTCQTGVAEAPNNVLMDERGQEFVFKQPEVAAELRDVLSAALCECFNGYGADGDRHWTLALIREWWATRFDLLKRADAMADEAEVRRWRQMLAGDAEEYLRAYAFFVEEGKVPTDSDRLPDLLAERW
ncbi:MAG: ferredoxin [Planctomycetes bacterium]|nr:ferredoxin [Planctomycetota bacterium]